MTRRSLFVMVQENFGTGVTLPAFPARAEWIDSSCYKLIQLSHADQFKEIKKEVAHDRHIAETAKVLKEARTAFQVPRRYLALDFETYELDHRFVTEFGISRLDTGAEGIIETRHLITQEYEAFRNGQYVPDCKHRFRHGSSRLLPLEACKAMLVESLQWADALIFHDTAADMDIIQGQLGLRLPRRGVPCYDTKVLFGAKEKSKKGESLGLGRMLQKLGVVAINMHNAGNDAHGTMEAFVSMMQPDLPRIECGTALVLQFESDDDLEF
ncbi:hypothetical protein BCR37DRAFT_387604 [Protomyces lactucae-debilis]|uniref:Gfd2/YDR514C-like C-terminal domain-containing protein n=1 Tax=Protomyces lactucae-debilis TaxID=2754530 RepID=A0A1Y2FFF9_PROLT|nr:uncharacterized protein BCR37DRAFT_387604 [Protomyces lactucae-debilis]ORY82144.1 hypothetical protein BCR37DRAFT_387604 [Protomyces lactucae-debilis]